MGADMLCFKAHNFSVSPIFQGRAKDPNRADDDESENAKDAKCDK